MGNQNSEPGARLVISVRASSSEVIELGDILTIGRSPGNGLVLNDPNASRRHAEIRRLDGNRYRLSDLGSSNGTWLNGKRLTVPKELKDGDRIAVGGAGMLFFAPGIVDVADSSTCSGTALFLRNELVVVLVADIRNFSRMSERLPQTEFSGVISRWFQEASRIIEDSGGTVDKFIGDAVMAFWVAADRSNPKSEVTAALDSASALLAKADGFSEEFVGQFPGHSFHIGIGLNIGDATLGNVGTGRNQSFTIMGPCVNVAFRLQSLSKEKGYPVIAARSIADYARESRRFADLGEVEVKGHTERFSICGLER